MRQRPPRQTVNRAAKIFVGGSGGLLCRVCDSSEGGARLRIECSDWVPDAFELLDQFSGIKRRVVVVWRRGTSVGVRFEDVPKAPLMKAARAFGRRG